MTSTKRGENGRLIGDANRKIIYEALRKIPDASATRLIAMTGLSQPTVLKGMRAVKNGWKPEEK